MKFDKLKVGQIIYECHSYRMGNTTLRTLGVWTAKVIELDAEKRRALISWNGNRAEWQGESGIAKYKEKEPILIKSGWGHRRPSHEELAEIRAKTKSEK